jgi:hypothetical protein
MKTLLGINSTSLLRKDNPEKMVRFWVCKYAGSGVLNWRFDGKGRRGEKTVG